MNYQEPAQTPQMPDEVLVRQVTGGDKQAFELIIRRHNQRLYRAGMSILNNEADVEDAMQSAYINAYLNLCRFESRSTFTTWLTRIMVNQCLELRRKRKLIKTAVEIPSNVKNMTTPDSILGNKELSSVLQNTIEQLPEKYRLVFILREVEELSVKETSEVLDIASSNVKIRLSRAKSMLKENLKSYMKDHIYSFHLSRCDRIVANVMASPELTC
jgi:RNA polymerase sigma factor (sigma-70 family)